MAKRLLLKVIVLGESGIGKTSLINRYVNRSFSEQYRKSIGVDFLCKEVELDGQHVTLEIWDTSGQKRFQSFGETFYRGACCCVLGYDITNSGSFEAVERHREELISVGFSDTDFPFVLIGIKSDLQAKRKVPRERARAWARSKNDIPVFEVSAKDGDQVNEAFLEVVRRALPKEPVVLVSNDGARVPFSAKIVKFSGFVKEVAGERPLVQDIPTEVSTEHLMRVKEYLRHHSYQTPPSIPTALPSSNLSDFISDWDDAFVSSFSRDDFQVFYDAVNYLQIQVLIELCGATTAIWSSAEDSQQALSSPPSSS
jgi:Ras-related protein Rab-7A